MNQTSTQCTRTDLANGVYELNVMEPSRQAVEELFAHLRTICDEAESQDTGVLKFLVLTTSKPLPFVITSSEIRKWAVKYGTVPSRTALMYEGAFATMADMMTRSFGSKRFPFRIFKPDEREAALAWLLETE